MLDKRALIHLYRVKKHSAAAIAKLFRCSQAKVNYWLKKYKISKRTISEAIYLKHNPHGDPFRIKEPQNLNEAILYGLGIGLYWGEGTKSNKGSVRLGNTDPKLIKHFIDFLIRIYRIDTKRLKFGLQIFSDMRPKEALTFWTNSLKVSLRQFQKVVVTPSRSLGTYRQKSKFGVLTVYYNNKKLRDILVAAIEKI